MLDFCVSWLRDLSPTVPLLLDRVDRILSSLNLPTVHRSLVSHLQLLPRVDILEAVIGISGEWIVMGTKKKDFALGSDNRSILAWFQS